MMNNPGGLILDLLDEKGRRELIISDFDTNTLIGTIKNITEDDYVFSKGKPVFTIFFPEGILDPKQLPSTANIHLSKSNSTKGKNNALELNNKKKIEKIIKSIEEIEFNPQFLQLDFDNSKDISVLSDLEQQNKKLLTETVELQKRINVIVNDLEKSSKASSTRLFNPFGAINARLTAFTQKVNTALIEVQDLRNQIIQTEKNHKYIIQNTAKTTINNYLKQLTSQQLFDVKHLSSQLLELHQLLNELPLHPIVKEILTAANISLPQNDWLINASTKNPTEPKLGQGFYIELTYKQGDFVLEANESFRIKIENINPIYTYTDGTVNIALRYANATIKNGGEKKIVQEAFSQTTPLNVINRIGKPLPFEVNIVNSSALQCEKKDKVKINFINVSGQDIVDISNAKIEMMYYVQNENSDEATNSLALTPKDQTKKLKFGLEIPEKQMSFEEKVSIDSSQNINRKATIDILEIIKNKKNESAFAKETQTIQNNYTEYIKNNLPYQAMQWVHRIENQLHPEDTTYGTAYNDLKNEVVTSIEQQEIQPRKDKIQTVDQILDFLEQSHPTVKKFKEEFVVLERLHGFITNQLALTNSIFFYQTASKLFNDRKTWVNRNNINSERRDYLNNLGLSTTEKGKLNDYLLNDFKNTIPEKITQIEKLLKHQKALQVLLQLDNDETPELLQELIKKMNDTWEKQTSALYPDKDNLSIEDVQTQFQYYVFNEITVQTAINQVLSEALSREVFSTYFNETSFKSHQVLVSEYLIAQFDVLRSILKDENRYIIKKIDATSGEATPIEQSKYQTILTGILNKYVSKQRTNNYIQTYLKFVNLNMGDGFKENMLKELAQKATYTSKEIISFIETQFINQVKGYFTDFQSELETKQKGLFSLTASEFNHTDGHKYTIALKDEAANQTLSSLLQRQFRTVNEDIFDIQSQMSEWKTTTIKIINQNKKEIASKLYKIPVEAVNALEDYKKYILQDFQLIVKSLATKDIFPLMQLLKSAFFSGDDKDIDVDIFNKFLKEIVETALKEKNKLYEKIYAKNIDIVIYDNLIQKIRDKSFNSSSITEFPLTDISTKLYGDNLRPYIQQEINQTYFRTLLMLAQNTEDIENRNVIEFSPNEYNAVKILLTNNQKLKNDFKTKIDATIEDAYYISKGGKDDYINQAIGVKKYEKALNIAINTIESSFQQEIIDKATANLNASIQYSTDENHRKLEQKLIEAVNENASKKVSEKPDEKSNEIIKRAKEIIKKLEETNPKKVYQGYLTLGTNQSFQLTLHNVTPVSKPRRAKIVVTLRDIVGYFDARFELWINIIDIKRPLIKVYQKPLKGSSNGEDTNTGISTKYYDLLSIEPDPNFNGKIEVRKGSSEWYIRVFSKSSNYKTYNGRIRFILKDASL